MRAMKDSGIEWIGEIPRDWDICKIKYLARMKSGETITSNNIDDDSPYPVYGGNGLRGYTKSFTHNGDYILIGRQGALCGNVHFVKCEFWASEHAIVTYELIPLEQNWLFYILSAMNLNQYSTSAAQPGLSVEQIQKLSACVPSLNEQTRIASFLDKKCAAIDFAIKNQRASIDKLKEYRQAVITEAVTKGLNPDVPMKDSGVEWIGEIPEGWEVRKLKQILNNQLQYGANETGEVYDENLPRYIRITDISSDGRLKTENKLSLDFEKAESYILDDKDILFARSGATVGKTFLYLKEFGISAFAGYLIRAKIDDNLFLPELLYYYTFSFCYSEWKDQIFIQATIQNIGADKYSELNVPIPSIPEQYKIVSYIDEKCSAIDEAVSGKEKLIEKLEEYKKSLIYEAVTGKIEITA